MNSRIWRGFDVDHDNAHVALKEEPLDVEAEGSNGAASAPQRPPTTTAITTDNGDDADVYMTEYVKVEAIISPKYTQKFLIPVDIPYTERECLKRRSLKAELRPPPSSNNIGKIQMRRTVDLLKPQPPPPLPRAPARRPHHGQIQNHRHRIQRPAFVHRQFISRMPDCFCQLCIRSTWQNSSQPVIYPRPELHIPYQIPPTNRALWRPFM